MMNQTLSVRLHTLCKALKPQDPDFGPDGNPNVQDDLVNLLQLQIGIKKVDELVVEKSDALRQYAEEVGFVSRACSY